ncbi:hypothetical protein B7463_g11940, partial [Scytalidium lignicola]
MASGPPWGAVSQAGGLTETAKDALGSFVRNEEKQDDEEAGVGAAPAHRSSPSTVTNVTDEKNDSEMGGEEWDGDKITNLARTFTQHSVKTTNGSYINPFLGSNDPLLDPTSGRFNQRAWIKTLIGITSRDPDRYPKRTAGVSYRNLNVHGFGTPTDYQKTFGNYPLEAAGLLNKLRGKGQTKIQILRHFDGLIKSGEMSALKAKLDVVVALPCSKPSQERLTGIPMEVMHKDFRGECIYQAEVDVHFPQLTVGQTLAFAAAARAPSNRIPGVSRKQYAEHMRDVIMAVFGLSHTINTKVGNDFIRGVSGGERKRVSIAEAALGGSPLQCWDNSTRGLDSATALEFVKTLRLSTELSGSTAVVAIYQASQTIYDVFDKVSVLYEGRQIYFGNIHAAKKFFLDMGFDCPERQTTADFLTSLTSPAERIPKSGFEHKVPQTPDEFEKAWLESEDHAQLMREIDQFEKEFPVGGEQLEKFKESRKAEQAKSQRIKSPYTISVPMQIKLCMDRGFQRVQGDASIVLTGIIANSIMALVVGSVFYNLAEDTAALYSRGALLFFAILLNAFSSALEILTLYAQRPIVEKQAKYAFYHPFAEAVASMICDLPNKILTSIFFNLALYFMTNLRRTPGAFFTFYLFSFMCVLAMSMIFRSIAALSRSLSQAMAPAAVLILALVIYTGFTIPTRDMHPWFRWINYLDPVAYAFEALMINEFHNRQIPCTSFVPAGPSYDNVSPEQRICSTTGAAAGANFIDGDTYIGVNFKYEHAHLWRNFGILWALVFGGLFIYLVATEYISAKRSKGEVLLFPRGNVPKIIQNNDEEGLPHERVTSKEVIHKTRSEVPNNIQKQTAIFHWDGVNYDIKIKGEPRRLLDGVDGWVKPGTLTALMGVSGAGKTTLLDVLASRVTMGVVTGQMLVNGRQRDSGFQRKTGYVQQQDLHLATSTVREALNFSALLRQPTKTPRAEKLAYVDEVINVLEMESYADAVVGVPGEGLNVEQRKRLTIGVEMAAKPDLLLFLDEPTSGLDSQTAWSICALLRKLANNGQAILCTIHQPSAILFQEFDRLLFLAKGGRTVYFGDIGKKSSTLLNYFERNGGRHCGVEENPAEYMLEITGNASEIEWPVVWRDSPERAEVKKNLQEMKEELRELYPEEHDPDMLREYAAPFGLQLQTALVRVFQQYWRTPSYLYSKVLLCVGSGLFIGFSFWKSPLSLQGIQNQMFSIFMLFTIFGNLVQQIMPHFVTQRALYEVRERPSKTYSWKVFILTNIIVELPWNTLVAVILFVTIYYPIGMYKNAIPAHQENERGGLMFLFIWVFLMFTSTFTDMVIAGIEMAETAGNLANLLFSLTLIFCGVLAGPQTLPGFWIFMYRVSPFTYLVDGILSVGLANTKVTCSSIEYLHFDPPSGKTCGQYMADYIALTGGYLVDANASSDCSFCTVAETNVYLKSLNSDYSHRWRNFGLLWVYILFNVFMAVFLYWVARVPKNKKKEKEA